MKKIIVILLAVVLVAAGLGSLAYANSNSHVPWRGDKLIGTSPFGTDQYSADEHRTMHASFIFTNPDCVNKIKIGGISIIRGDGTVIYEGPLLWQRHEDGEIVESTIVDWSMEPHDIWSVVLMCYMPDPGDPDHEWMSLDEALAQPLAQYTVEISWGVHRKGGLPLIGKVQTIKRTVEFGEVMESAFGTQMVNMEQALKPEKEKEVTTLRLQTWFGPEDPLMVPLENFAQAVNNQSDSVRIELYPAGALVSPWWELAEAVRQGEIEMGLVYSMWLRDYSRVMDAGWLPFLYNGR